MSAEIEALRERLPDAARDLKLEGAQSDGDASERYAGFAHGRQCIRRFGATSVAAVVLRAGADA